MNTSDTTCYTNAQSGLERNLRSARAEDLPAIIALLSECGLPSSDLSMDKLASFYVVESDGRLVGVGGLEKYDSAGLLRSIAVAPGWRGKNLGTLLVRQCEAAARRVGVETLYLLTTTADDFFRRLGYTDMEREAVPVAVAASSQFRGLCPSSAKCLGKRL